MQHCALHALDCHALARTTSITVPERTRDDDTRTAHTNRHKIVLFRCWARRIVRRGYHKYDSASSWPMWRHTLFSGHLVLHKEGERDVSAATSSSSTSHFWLGATSVRCIMSIIIHATNTIYYYYIIFVLISTHHSLASHCMQCYAVCLGHNYTHVCVCARADKRWAGVRDVQISTK